MEANNLIKYLWELALILADKGAITVLELEQNGLPLTEICEFANIKTF